MKLEPEPFGALRVHSWHLGELRIGQDLWRQPVLLNAREARPWALGDGEEITLNHLAPLIAEQPDLILLGTGERQRFPPQELGMGLLARGIGLEVMDTAAACRTYNVLLSEGRAVAAALRIR